MSTRKHLSLLLVVFIGGIGLVALVATGALAVIRGEIVRLAGETSPSQVRLAKLQLDLERIAGAFWRISASSSMPELNGIQAELRPTLQEMQSIGTEVTPLVWIAASGAQGPNRGSLQQAGEELTRIASERIEARERVIQAHRQVMAEIERVAGVTETLSSAMAQLQRKSESVLSSSQQRSLGANENIKVLLIEGEKVEQLRAYVEESRNITDRFRLNVLRDKTSSVLAVMLSQTIHDEDFRSRIDLFAQRFEKLFAGEPGLLQAHIAYAAAPAAISARADYAQRRQAVVKAVDEIAQNIAEEIDPLELAVYRAARGMNEATALISRVSSVSADVSDIAAAARSIQNLAWQLLGAGDIREIGRIERELAQCSARVAAPLSRIQANVARLEGSDGFKAALKEGAQAFDHTGKLLTGANGVASVVRQELDKQKRSDLLFAASLGAIRRVRFVGARRALEAESAQETAVRRIQDLSAWTFVIVMLIGAAILLAGCIFGGRIRNEILASEEGQNQLKDKLRRQAFHDALTGLPNRLMCGELISRAIQESTAENMPFAVFCVDLDRFKQVNDRFGHRFGDRYLIALSHRMSAAVGERGVVFRTGGDEFTVLLRVAGSRERIEETAGAILQALCSPVTLEGHSLQGGGSIGIAHFPRDGRDAEMLQRHADQAMYSAKNAGRNQYAFFDWEVNRSIEERREMQETLREAAAAGSFHLNYQPQFARDGRMTGAEALLRFQHPALGLISPAQFIPIAEEGGVIIEIGNWVLREAVRQAVEWRKSGLPPIRMAVNVSALQFIQPDFCEQVRRVLAESGLAPHLLELELTESVIISDLEQAHNQIEALRELGVQISIDDFGTGFSSLSYLHKLPVNAIKIDQSFVRDLHASNSTRPLIQAIVSAAHAFGFSVVAEGVETEAQRQTLVALRCDCMQGYLFSRPVSPEAMARLLAAGRKAGAVEEEEMVLAPLQNECVMIQFAADFRI